jgi:hypothetical protein
LTSRPARSRGRGEVEVERHFERGATARLAQTSARTTRAVDFGSTSSCRIFVPTQSARSNHNTVACFSASASNGTVIDSALPPLHLQPPYQAKGSAMSHSFSVLFSLYFSSFIISCSCSPLPFLALRFYSRYLVVHPFQRRNTGVVVVTIIEQRRKRTRRGQRSGLFTAAS